MYGALARYGRFEAGVGVWVGWAACALAFGFGAWALAGGPLPSRRPAPGQKCGGVGRRVMCAPPRSKSTERKLRLAVAAFASCLGLCVLCVMLARQRLAARYKPLAALSGARSIARSIPW